MLQWTGLVRTGNVNSIHSKITRLEKNARVCYPLPFMDCWLGDDVDVGHVDIAIIRIDFFGTWIG